MAAEYLKSFKPSRMNANWRGSFEKYLGKLDARPCLSLEGIVLNGCPAKLDDVVPGSQVRALQFQDVGRLLLREKEVFLAPLGAPVPLPIVWGKTAYHCFTADHRALNTVGVRPWERCALWASEAPKHADDYSWLDSSLYALDLHEQCLLGCASLAPDYDPRKTYALDGLDAWMNKRVTEATNLFGPRFVDWLSGIEHVHAPTRGEFQAARVYARIIREHVGDFDPSAAPLWSPNVDTGLPRYTNCELAFTTEAWPCLSHGRHDDLVALATARTLRRNVGGDDDGEKSYVFPGTGIEMQHTVKHFRHAKKEAEAHSAIHAFVPERAYLLQDGVDYVWLRLNEHLYAFYPREIASLLRACPVVMPLTDKAHLLLATPEQHGPYMATGTKRLCEEAQDAMDLDGPEESTSVTPDVREEEPRGQQHLKTAALCETLLLDAMDLDAPEKPVTPVREKPRLPITIPFTLVTGGTQKRPHEDATRLPSPRKRVRLEVSSSSSSSELLTTGPTLAELARKKETLILSTLNFGLSKAMAGQLRPHDQLHIDLRGPHEAMLSCLSERMLLKQATNARDSFINLVHRLAKGMTEDVADLLENARAGLEDTACGDAVNHALATRQPRLVVACLSALSGSRAFDPRDPHADHIDTAAVEPPHWRAKCTQAGCPHVAMQIGDFAGAYDEERGPCKTCQVGMCSGCRFKKAYASVGLASDATVKEYLLKCNQGSCICTPPPEPSMSEVMAPLDPMEVSASQPAPPSEPSVAHVLSTLDQYPTDGYMDLFHDI